MKERSTWGSDARQKSLYCITWARENLLKVPKHIDDTDMDLI